MRRDSQRRRARACAQMASLVWRALVPSVGSGRCQRSSVSVDWRLRVTERLKMLLKTSPSPISKCA